MNIEKTKSNIKISNFGAVKYIDLNISPFTVFIGPNSSGKSFVAKLVHCFKLKDGNNLFSDCSRYLYNSFKYQIEDNEPINKISAKISDYIKSKPTLNSEPLIIPNKELHSFFKIEFLSYLSNIIEDEITGQFEENPDNLINFNENSFKIQIRNNTLEKIKKSDFKTEIEYPLVKENTEINIGEHTGILIHGDENNVYIRMSNPIITNNQDLESEIYTLFSVLSTILLKNILLEHSYYIPAERSEIIMDNKLLTRKVLDQSDISKNQAEVLANIINIEPYKKSPFYELGCELEKEFSGIHAVIDDSNIFNNIIYKNSKTGEELSSKLLSTSIHEMTIFSLYLKYVLKKGDLLIIEEPEAHLHPENQRILVKYFVKAINQGLKIMITTHSDYIVSQIDNMINLNNIDESKLGDLDFNKEDILNKNDINIYNFKRNNDNSYDAEKIEIKEDGFIEDNFSKITDELYNETIKIRNLSFR